MIGVSEPIDILHPTLTTSAEEELGVSAFCGDITTVLSVAKDGELLDEVPSFILDVNGLITFKTTDSANRGTYTLYLTHTIVSSPDITLTETLVEINVVNQCIDSNTISVGELGFESP